MMKIKSLKSSLIFIFLFMTLGCQLSFVGIEFKKAQKAEKENRNDDAVHHYFRVLRRDPESKIALKSARQAARLSLVELGDFRRAIEFFQHLVLYSPDFAERIRNQEEIAKIYFDKLNNYDKAIVSYSELLNSSPADHDQFRFRHRLAKAYFYKRQFFQARSEIDAILKLQDIDDLQRFSASLLKGNVYFAEKNLPRAIETYQGLLKNYTKFSDDQNVYLNLVASYEELQDFEAAIDVIREVRPRHPSPDILDAKIKRLKKRQSNLPGYKGLRK